MAKKFRILSIDGGGVRGILSGEILVELEKKIQQVSGNQSARIADYFDMIAGNSTGGILSCLYLCPDDDNLTRPKYSAIDAVDIYLKHGQEIFKDEIREKILMSGGLTSETYPVSKFENLLHNYFGDKKLSQLLRHSFIPSYNITARTTHFFTQCDAKREKAFDFYIKDVARSTSAAPAYFPPALVESIANEKFSLVDGGVFANNPAMCAYIEAICNYTLSDGNKKLTVDDIFFLSIGTGAEKRSLQYEEAKGWGMVGWVFPVLDIVMSGATDTVDFQLRTIFDAAGKRENYVRINPSIGKGKPEMDNASNFNLKALKAAGEQCAEEHNKLLVQIAEKVVKGA